MLKQFTEGSISFEASDGTVTADMDVFYNPVMQTNRDVSIALFNALEREEKSMRCLDLLSGSGIRALRMLKECPAVETMLANDWNPQAIESLEKSAEKNGLADDDRFTIHHGDALNCLAKEKAFDYVDVDPFGTPNRFLPLAIERTKNKGILAVTATDTSALCGTYVRACKRKYWSTPLRTEQMHEVGMRILIRKIQLEGAAIERALVPIYCFSTDHYVRVFFQCLHGKSKVDALLKEHKFLHVCPKTLRHYVSHYNKDECCDQNTIVAGPMFTGDLWDKELAQKVAEVLPTSMTELIAAESKIPVVSMYDLHRMTKFLTGSIPRVKHFMQAIEDAGYKVAKTHFLRTAIRTDCPHSELLKIHKQLQVDGVEHQASE